MASPSRSRQKPSTSWQHSSSAATASVDKAELMKLVWPDSFVEEANLSQTIFVLRKTLGDDANGRPFIDTVPRRGYRFAAEAHTTSEPPMRPRTAVWGAAAVAAVILVS